MHSWASENLENPWESMYRSCEHMLSLSSFLHWKIFHIFSDELATFANHQRKRWPFQKPKLRFKDLRWTFFNALTLGQERWQSKTEERILITKGRPPKFEALTCVFLVLIFHDFFMNETPEVVGSFCHVLSMTCCLLWICYDQACQKARTPVIWWVVCRSPFSCWKICGVQQSPTCPTCVAGRINWDSTSMCSDITQRLGWCFNGR